MSIPTLQVYLESELLLMPSYLKNQLVDEMKETNAVLEGEDIDAFLLRVLREHQESFLIAYNKLVMRKSFKYSALFELDDPRNINDILDPISCEGNTTMLTDSMQTLNPVRIDGALKFTFLLQGGRIENLEFRPYKTSYTILVSFLEISGNKFVEIDADNVATYFRHEDANFFVNMINRVSEWLRSNCLLTLHPIDLVNVLDEFKNDVQNATTQNSPLVSAQKMILGTGSQATLDSADSETIILPILGELKQLIEDNDDLFSQATDIKILLENFITETEEEADLPWITFVWDNRVKSKKMQVKFFLSDQPYTLLNYYHHTRGRGGMNDATKCLLEKYSESRTVQVTSNT